MEKKYPIPYIEDDSSDEEEEFEEELNEDITDFRLFGEDDEEEWKDIIDSFYNDGDEEDLKKLFAGLNIEEKK